MASSGQQIAVVNAQKFDAWVHERTAANDWASYVRDNKLNRTEIARECGFAKSVLQQNPAIKTALAAVERDLLAKGVLRAQEDIAPVERQSAIVANRDKQRLNQLEQQNDALRAEIHALKALLKHYDLMDEFLGNNGKLPR